ncbi:MAG: glycosyltransferase family 4 protein [Gammaproteobacteria bacterium]|nr:glycosyltransferase family 4 protein [Gammaproteobacteria bacterium]
METTVNSQAGPLEKPLKILLYSNSFLPQVGGREIVIYHLAKSLQQAGHQVLVVSPGGWWSYRKLAYPFRVQRWPKIPGLSTVRSSMIHLAATVSRFDCDVINAHATYPAGYAALLYKGFTGMPLVVTPHGEDIHVIPEIGHGLRLQPEYAQKIADVVKTAERLTAISGSVVASLLDAGASAQKIVTIPNGVDFDRFTTDTAVDVRARFAIPGNKRILLTVGNYVRRRGHEELVRAMRPIVDANGDAHLVIVGRGTDVLEALIAELGLGESVTLTGAVPPVELNPQADDIVAALYRESEVYVAPGMSEGSEGLSLALLDAMASGSAIVATRISGNRDVISSDKNGLLVEPGKPQAIAQGVLHMLNNPEAQRAYREQAANDVQPYSWTSIAAQYEKTYREAIQISNSSTI